MGDYELHPSFLELKAPKRPKDPRFDLEGIFDTYFERVGPEFPNIPKDAFSEWLYMFWHEDHIQKLYGYLDIKALVFIQETWSLGQCLSIQWYDRFKRVSSVENDWSVEHFQRQYRGWEGDVVPSWIEKGTWFSPIWVLDTTTFGEKVLHQKIKKPLMLIEGHSRLGTLRLFAKNDMAGPEHRVWVVRHG